MLQRGAGGGNDRAEPAESVKIRFALIDPIQIKA